MRETCLWVSGSLPGQTRFFERGLELGRGALHQDGVGYGVGVVFA